MAHLPKETAKAAGPPLVSFGRGTSLSLGLTIEGIRPNNPRLWVRDFEVGRMDPFGVVGDVEAQAR